MPGPYQIPPGLYQSGPLPELSGDKAIKQERIANEFLSPQEQILRRAMQMGNFQPADLSAIEPPRGYDLKAIVNALRPAPAPIAPQPETGVITPPPINAAKVDAQAMPKSAESYNPESELDADIAALKNLSGRK